MIKNNMIRFTSSTLLSLTAVSLFITSLDAQAEEKWNIRISPYMWLAGSKGHTGFIGDTTAPLTFQPLMP